MFRRRLPATAFALTLVAALASCADHAGPDPVPTGEATLSVALDLTGTMVTTVVLDVTAPDIQTMLVFNIPIVNGVATGTITVPAGSNRSIVLRGFDVGGVQTHSGSVTLSIQPGTNATVSLVLTPLTGDLPITATLGSYIVTVSPPAASLAVTATAQLSATIQDSNGNPTTGSVAWATHNPGVAMVDGTGLVTATGAGTTTITAVFQGVAGTATITVTP